MRTVAKDTNTTKILCVGQLIVENRITRDDVGRERDDEKIWLV